MQKYKIWNVKKIGRGGGATVQRVTRSYIASKVKKVNVEVDVLAAPLPAALVWKIALRVQIWKDRGSKSKNAWSANASLPLEIAFTGILD